MERDQLLQDKDELQRTQDDYQSFKKKVSKSFRKRLPDVQDSKEGLLKEISLFGDGPQLQAQADLAIHNTSDALAQLGEKRRHWYRKLGRHAQELATKFAGFVTVYGSFIDVARQAGGPYAEVAYGTLPLVAIKKSENDDKFVDTLEEIQNSFPRVKMAELLYSQDSVKDKVLKVYRQVILFSREATEYFIANTSGRVLKAIIRPAPLAVDKAIEALHHCLAEVNAEIGILLHQRVLDITHQSDDIKAQNERLRLEVGKIRAQLTKMKENAEQESSRKDDENLEELRRLLGEDLQEHRDPGFCRENLEDAFPEALGASRVRQGRSANYYQMTSQLLGSDAAYQSWRECSSSCLLVFAGSTALQGRAAQSPSACWLSPAALHVFDFLQLEDTTRVAFFTCQPNFRADKISSRQVVSSLVCQLLAWKPELLRYTMKKLKATVESDAWNSEDNGLALACQFHMLTEVISFLPADMGVALILDRLDLCRESTHLILQALQGLFKHRPNGLRILTVMETILNDYVRGECQDFIKHGVKFHSFGKVNWDQTQKSY
ncbi:MAG: hypothetical protein Q9181_002988 [Wetmoreana brouardii]